MLYDVYLSTIDRLSSLICSVADTLWDDPELGYAEYHASDLLTRTLSEHGFTVERGVAGIPTAFRATFGEGEPRLGILAEYDALAGLNQVACETAPAQRPGITNGHGCGHNLFAAGSLAAALAVKSYIEAAGKGSVTLFGCPAEEGGGGKVFMARAGAFSGIDAIVSWHPESMYMVRTRPALANVEVDYTFDGVASHAGAAPDKGRSALDAVELMNVGVNFLREHMELTSRIHYAILDSGGTAPNIVQSHAVVRYLIRAVDAASVRELRARVDRIAQGAALMTDTKVSWQTVSAYSDLITIPALQACANEAMHDIPLPVPTEEELAFGRTLQTTWKLTPAQAALPPFAMTVRDPAPPVAHGGSTDTADVSWNCPTVQMHIGTWAVGTPGHSWQSTSQSRGSYAKKAAMYAGKAVAATLMRLMEHPEILAQAKAEHAEKTAGGYVCPLPEDLQPAIHK